MIWLCLILGVFLTINLATASLSPTVWMDEVMLADPAINLRLFGYFTSSAWYAQSDQAFWSGYPPLYSFLLSAWLWVAPVSPTGVRSLNLILMTLSCIAFWFALRHSQAVRSPSARLLFVALILCGFCTSFSYRSGRPDTLGLFLVSLLALLVVSKSSGLRLELIFAVGSLLPWAGLQLVVYVSILMVIVAGVTRTVPQAAVFLAAGIAAGGMALGLLYAAKGTLTAYIESALPHTTLVPSQVDASLLTVARKMLAAHDYSSLDFSSLLLLPMIAIVALLAFRQTRESRQVLLSFVLAIIIVPPTLRLLGKYPVYYFWMSFIPMSFLAVFVVDNAQVLRKPVAIAAFGLVCFAMLAGLPMRIALAIAESNGRDYGEVSAFVTSALNSEDRAYIDFAAYYPAKLRANKVYLPTYLQIISDAERRGVTVAILSGGLEDPVAFLSKEFGGNWEKAGPEYAPAVSQNLLSFVKRANPYRLVVLRRKSGTK